MKKLSTFLIQLIAVIFFSFLFLIVSNEEVYSQAIVRHDLGKMLADVISDYTWDNWEGGVTEKLKFDYPQGHYRRTILRRWEQIAVVNQLESMEGLIEYDKYLGFVVEMRKRQYIDLGLTKLTEYRRSQPPKIVVDRVDVSRPFYGEVDANIPSDVMIVLDWGGYEGVSGVQTSYSFQNQNHDSYILNSTSLKLTLRFGVDIFYPDQTLDLVWTERMAFEACRVGQENATGSWREARSGGFTERELYASNLVTDKPRKDIWISYYYDADDKNIITPIGLDRPTSEIRIDPSTGLATEFDDLGDPDPETGMFLSPQYVGMATLHADKSPSDQGDDPSIPRAVTYECIYDAELDYWTGSTFDFYATDNVAVPIYEYMGPTFNCEDVRPVYNTQGWGPYTMKKDDEVNSVYVIAGGMIDPELCLSEGKKWYNWYWDDPGEKLDDAGKNALIATSKDSLFRNIDRAYWAYHRGYDVPDPPPVPDIEVSSGANKVDITWGYPNADMFRDPDTGTDDFLEWRLYRKIGGFYVDDALDVNNYFRYELIGTYPKNTTSLIDDQVMEGVQYHYCVTAVDDGTQNTDGLFPEQSLESSYYKNRTLIPVKAFTAGKDVSTEVLIVPNPFSVSTGASNEMNWPGAPNEIQFKNLPAYCTLKIYTATGELIKTIEHFSGSGDEAWTTMRTDSNQYPASGVYILVIDDAQDSDKNPLPKEMYKFVLVR